MDADGQGSHLKHRAPPWRARKLGAGVALGIIVWGGASALTTGCALSSYEYLGPSASGGSAGSGGGGGGGGSGGGGPTGCPPADQALTYSGCGDLSLSADHCGACGRSCAGSQCVLGHCEKLQLLSSFNTSAVAVVSDELLAVADLDVGLRWVPRNGGTSTIDDTVGAYDVAYREADDRVYWTDWGATTSRDGLWRAAPGSGDAPEQVLTGNGPRDVVVDDAGVYFIDDGGAAISLFIDEPGGETTARITETPPARVARITTDENFVYWRRQDENGAPLDGVFRALKRSGKGSAEVPGLGRPRSMVAADGYLYATLGGARTAELDCVELGSVVRVPVTTDGIGALEVIADAEPCPDAIAVDADYVYWSIRELDPGGAIRRSPRHCDPDPETVAFGLALPASLDVGSDALFFVETDLQTSHVTLASKRPDP